MSDKKISDDVVMSAAELLVKGAKMLRYYCPECKIPLFEKDERTFCPSCNREFKIVEEGVEELAKDFENKKTETQVIREEVHPETKKVDVVLKSSLIDSIEKAAIKVCEMILSSNSYEEVKELSESLSKLVAAMELVKKIEGRR
ncbi:MAG: Sjogren's syndrome/scleroderma autoantigen 1 family protein [Archaeoglobales archaeon]|nr:Sjogren's syndrome/scleroderma autoantigen 1 family protein [Archaeoglobales archaeon]